MELSEKWGGDGDGGCGFARLRNWLGTEVGDWWAMGRQAAHLEARRIFTSSASPCIVCEYTSMYTVSEHTTALV